MQADALQIAQLLQNLIGNALKFHRPDESPRIAISASETETEWVVSVEDHGIGVDPRFAERIFVIFRRLQSREEYPGTGIGLAIARRSSSVTAGASGWSRWTAAVPPFASPWAGPRSRRRPSDTAGPPDAGWRQCVASRMYGTWPCRLPPCRQGASAAAVRSSRPSTRCGAPDADRAERPAPSLRPRARRRRPAVERRCATEPPLRLLLVEDNPADAELLASSSPGPGAGARLHAVDRLALALAAVAESSFDAVLLDLSLPDAEQLEGVASLSAAAPDLPIVVMTGLRTSGLRWPPFMPARRITW